MRWAADPDRLPNLKKGLLYINIHTTSFPAGEIRGQILVVKGAKY